MVKTKIEWTDATWNFISGCTQISPACQNCYAKSMTKRLQGMAKAKTAKLRCKKCGFDLENAFEVEDCDLESGKVFCAGEGDRNCNDIHEAFGLPMYWFGWDKVLFHGNELYKILDKKKYKSGSKVFVCSMGDLFHEDINFYDIVEVFDFMRQRQDLTFQILTKRPERMLEFFNEFLSYYFDEKYDKFNNELYKYFYEQIQNHVLLGVTAETQAMADKRIPILLQCKHLTMCKAFVSIEPILELVNIVKYIYTKDHPPFGGDPSDYLDWVIVGGESGMKARPTEEEWILDLYDQCYDYGVAFFFKQKGNNFIEPKRLVVSKHITRVFHTKEFPNE